MSAQVKPLRCEIIHDNFQNYKKYNVAKAQLVIADIPYNIGTDAYGSNPMWYKGGDNANGESKLAKRAFFNSDGYFKIAEYMHFCSRLLRPEPKEKGKAPAMIVFCAFDQIHTVAEYGARYGFKNWYPLFFCKNYSAQVLKANMRIVGATEFAVVLYRDKLPKFNNGRQIGEDGKPIRGTGKMVFDWFQWERDGKDIPKIHPTQKPVKVLRRLIEIFTDPGEFVIDPCCGSGSTLRAAAEAGRSAIGFEIDKSFYMAAKEKMLAGVREAQKTARDAGSQITIGEIAEAAQQGGETGMRFVCDACQDITNIEADQMEIQGEKLMVYSRGRLVYVADLGQIMLAKLTPGREEKP